jgi:signal transduction histidine kinase/uncharacterized membrane protein (GlpM family)
MLYSITGAGQLLYIYLIIGLAFNLVQLENTLRASRGTNRWQIKYIVFGVGAILAYFIYLSSQVLLFGMLEVPSVAVLSAVIAIAIAIMGVFIVRHRLLDVDIFISRYVVYNSVTILIIGSYLLAAGVVTELIRYFGVPFNRFLVTLFVFVTLLLLVVFLFTTTIRRKIKLFINRNFYRHKYEFRDKWMETIERVSSRRSTSEIEETLKEMITETMGARSVHLWLYSTKTREFICRDPEVPEDYRRVREDHPIAKRVADIMAPFYFTAPSPSPSPAPGRTGTEGDDASAAGEVELKSATGAEVCAPLVAGADIVGFLLVGADLSGQPYAVDDFELLSAVTTQAAVQIRNIELTREIMTVTELNLFNKMSSFIMHDIKNLTNSLSLISQNASLNMDNPEFQKDAIETIDATVTRMKSLIERLSTVPRGVELKKTASDLSEIVYNTLKKIPISPKKNIEIGNTVTSPIPITVDPEAIEMVVFNIVNNAAEAIKASGKILISATSTNAGAVLFITDDGPGMTGEFILDGLFTPFKSTKKKGFGIGLYQCKAIVEAHGGSIDVKSAPGAGSTFTIRLPEGA